MQQGWTFVWGKTPETARALIAAAEDIGFDPKAIRTTDLGFIVQDEVWQKAQYALMPHNWTTPEAVF